MAAIREDGFKSAFTVPCEGKVFVHVHLHSAHVHCTVEPSIESSVVATKPAKSAPIQPMNFPYQCICGQTLIQLGLHIGHPV